MKLTHSNIEDVLFVLILLFIGSDLISFKLFEFTIRYINVLITFSFIFLLVKNKLNIYLPKKFVIVCILLTISMILSLPLSYDKTRTIAYTLWFIYTVFIMIPFLYYFASKNNTFHVIILLLITLRIQVFLLFIELIYLNYSNENVRPHLWFYEPSYLAIYFSFYFGVSIYLKINCKEKSNIDLILSILGLLLLTSATAMFALIIGFFASIILSNNKFKNLILITVLSLIIYFIGKNYFYDNEYYIMTAKIFENSDGFKEIISNIFHRSGTRIIRFLWGWDAFLNHPIFGIGFGADQTYTRIFPIPEIAEKYLKPWESPHGNPFVNPLIEALATIGIFGFIFLSYLFLQLLILYKDSKKILSLESNYARAIIVGVIVMILTLQMEGTFLRYYLWSSYAIAWGMINKLKNDSHYNNTDIKLQ